MTISTNKLPTTGVFLDPTGNFQINHTGVISGAIIGGDTHDSSFVSGADLVLPPIPFPPGGSGGGTGSVPEPASFIAWSALAAIGLIGFGSRRRTRAV
jgi:PEP-CTERM motif